MSTTPQLRDVISSLFVEPIHGFNKAQAEALKLWLKYLEAVAKLNETFGARTPPATPEEEAQRRADHERHIRSLLEKAPKWSAVARGEVGVVMRLTSAQKTKGSMQLGLAVGPFQGGGSFSLVRETSSESVIQARAEYSITNSQGEQSLLDFLAESGFEPTQLAEADGLHSATELLDSLSRDLAADES